MKRRVITALLLLAIFLPILYLGGIVFNLAVLIIGVLGLKEMLDIKKEIPIAMKLTAFAIFIYFVFSFSSAQNFVFFLDYRIISLILLVLLLPIIFYHDEKKYNINDALSLIGIIFFLGLSFNLIISIRSYNLNLLIYLFLITIVTDTYAYIGGSLIGKNKLLEKISPKKTWEGLIVGTIFGVMISSLFYYATINYQTNIFVLIFSTALLSIIGQFGDLVFSSIKRLYGKKDFSNLLPGHGGVLDRLDSFIFVSLGYVLLMLFI